MSPRKILVVDDRRENCYLLRTLLSRAGYDVETVSDGQAACDRLLKGEPPYPELLLVDLQMPRMNGFQTLAHLRGHDCNVPVIAVSAESDSVRADEAVAAGFCAYIAKPIDSVGLLKTIENSLPGGVSGVVESKARAQTLLDALPPSERKRFLGVFAAGLPARMTEIADCLAKGDTGGLGRAAHALAGSAAMFNDLALSKAARSLEHAALKEGTAASELESMTRELLRLTESTRKSLLLT